MHVAELSIDGALFHIHEDVPASGQLEDPTVLKANNGGNRLVRR